MDTSMDDDLHGERPRIRNSQACLECRKAKIKCNGKRKDAQNCSRCEAKGLECNWTASRRGKKPGTKNLATRAREQSEAMQRQLEKQLQPSDSNLKPERSTPVPHDASTSSLPSSRNEAWGNSGASSLPNTYPHVASIDSHHAYRHGSNASTANHQSPQSAITSSSSASYQSSSLQTVPSSNILYSITSNTSSRRTSKYHDGLLIRESRMPPSSTNPLLCLSEAALGKRCTESDSEEDELAAEPADHALDRLEWDTRRCDPLDRGIVTMDDVHRLFGIFMDVIHEQFCILDPIIHNVETIKKSSNFLFSVILAIATSVDPSSRSIQQFQQLRALVDSLVVEVLSRNVKSVEVVKGLIVWPMWAHLTPLMAEDRAWLLIGTAARMTKELDLAMRDDTPQDDDIARRHARDRSRTWALAAIMERSFSSFSGQRPNTTLDVDWGTLNDWLKSPVSLDGDIQIVAFLHLRRIEEIMRTRIFSQSYYEVGSIESIRVSANVLFSAWYEAWCEHPALDKHRLTSTIMRIIGLHLQTLINTHAIRESDRRKAICEASGMRILRICSDSVKAARENCVEQLTDACRLALDNLKGHAHTVSRIVAAMLGWSGVHLLKNGPIETRGLVVQLGLMLAGNPQDSTHSRSFARFYGRFILSLSAELAERDRAEKSRRKRQRLRDSSHMSAGSSGHGVPSPRAAGDAVNMRRSVTTGSGAPGYESKKSPAVVPSPGAATAAAAAVSDMALAFESAAQSGLQISGLSGRPGPVGASGAGMNDASSSSPGGNGYTYPYASTPGAPASGAGNSYVGCMFGNGGRASSPLSSNYRSMPAPGAGNSASTLDSVTSTWLGTDDLLDSYMQSILPIFNDFDHATNNSMAHGIHGGGGVGVPISEVGR
ncbi:uncharacterized protein UMAG_15041 [Mycosarcoma maydis]|uniref:Zn(2)-C6 fungal-type domain-containing protein n=1 Tax=Mycosarcoma maydis TaxID=5270 RepID=A0A0D1E9C1_MYCMD|nr:uncharacterized protein UMAG_15041 [Ustilago maydis 521]KIS71951.1 hypothetical protein UMAG_15041 [Ustilago maydis 521]|eukprot:XP_011386859.1 hypothetical protein UMAG_15041 [Ustilago maydis 521]